MNRQTLVNFLFTDRFGLCLADLRPAILLAAAAPLAAIAAAVWLRSAYDVLRPVAMGDYAEDGRAKAQWLAALSVTCLLWLALALLPVRALPESIHALLTLVRLAMGAAGAALLLRALIRMQLSFYARPDDPLTRANLSGDIALPAQEPWSDRRVMEDKKTTELLLIRAAGVAASRPTTPPTATSNLPALMLGGALLGLALWSWRANGVCF